MTLAATLACVALLPGAASAAVTITPYGGTTDARTGGHGDLTTGVTYDYGSDTKESVRRVLIETPSGGYGNPNAVSWADRCTVETFESGTCDPKSQIGVVTISATAYFGIIPIPMNDMTGTISIIQKSPEIPTIVGAYIQPSIGDPIRAYARFHPVTSGPDGDFRVRTETDPFPRTAHALGMDLPIQITKYEQKLFGKLANGNPFITNPTRCDTWNTWGYDEFFKDNSGADRDPLGEGKNNFKRAATPHETTPNCKTLAPLTVTADSSIQGSTRGAPVAFSTEIRLPGVQADPQVADVAKKIVTVLPDAVNVDVQQLGRLCSNEDFTARICPAGTKVGSVNIDTPQVAAGLTGSVHLVKATPPNNLPDLGVIVGDTIKFNLRGTTRFVNRNQIQTTFDNNPPVGFTSFKLSIAGGANGLLLLDRCPSDGSEPGDGGPTQFSVETYQGQKTSFSSKTTYASPSCISYSVGLKSIKKCVKKRSFTAKPQIRSLGQVSQVKYYIGKKQVARSKKAPFKKRIKIKQKIKLKKNKKYRYSAKVYFKPDAQNPSGRVVKKSAKFKLCG